MASVVVRNSLRPGRDPQAWTPWLYADRLSLPLVFLVPDEEYMSLLTNEYTCLISVAALPCGSYSWAVWPTVLAWSKATRCPSEAGQTRSCSRASSAIGSSHKCMHDSGMISPIGVDGTKHALGLWEGSTENATVCQSLLANLQSRGLRTAEHPRDARWVEGATGGGHGGVRSCRAGAALPNPQDPQHPRPSAGASAVLGTGDP